ncbi:MAG: trypsin-like serine protease [Ignavibacteria bacterium]|nr:trypsin-like serine protease [Ignavibacteria bacterium]
MKQFKYHPVIAAFLLAIAAHPLNGMAGFFTEDSRIARQADDEITSSRQNTITKAVKLCSPAVVGINVTETRTQYYRDPMDDFFRDPFFEQFFGRRSRTYKQDYEVRSLGSGFIISSDGYILTNDHVAGNASKIVITLTDGSKHDATVIGTDPTTDITLLKIDGSGFPALKFASSRDLEVGEWAIAFGNPFGLFDNNAKPTVTVGVVSNTNVSFTQADDGGFDRVYRDMIQTDAAISSGNSGGPLVNASGEVIGMNTVIYSTATSSRGAGSIGIGFAIPIDRVQSIYERLKSKGTIDRDFWTGMKVTSITEDVKSYYNLKSNTGVLVSQILAGSPADDAGIEPGDVIIAVDGLPTLRDDDLNIAILDAELHQTLLITVLRDGREKVLSLQLKKRPRSGGVKN